MQSGVQTTDGSFRKGNVPPLTVPGLGALLLFGGRSPWKGPRGASLFHLREALSAPSSSIRSLTHSFAHSLINSAHGNSNSGDTVLGGFHQIVA